MRNCLLAFAAAFAACSACSAGPWQGVVTRVSDGDTLWVRPVNGGKPRKLRIDGIDAPEICQTWGVKSREALSSRVLNQTVLVQGLGVFADVVVVPAEQLGSLLPRCAR